MPIGSVLGRRLVDPFKSLTVMTWCNFASENSIAPFSSFVEPKRYRSYQTESGYGPKFRRSIGLCDNNTTLRLSSSMTTSIESKVNDLIENNKIVVFSKSYCPFCTETKILFEKMNLDFALLELDQMGNEGIEMQTALFTMTNQKSVPNVFVNGIHIGGNDDTQAAARNGTLQDLLK